MAGKDGKAACAAAVHLGRLHERYTRQPVRAAAVMCVPPTKVDGAFSKAMLKSCNTIPVWTVLKNGNQCDHPVHYVC